MSPAAGDESVGRAVASAPAFPSADPASVPPPDGPERLAPSSPWEEFRTHAAGHLDMLELAATSLIEGQTTNELLSHAFLGARSLEQSLTTRGLFEGARMAREIAHALDGNKVLFPPQLLQLCELIVQLESVIDQTVKPLAMPTGNAADGPIVLVVSRDRGLAGRLAQTSRCREFQALAAEFPSMAGDLFVGGSPTAAVLDLHAGGGVERGLLLLDEFANQVPPIPVIVLMHTDALAHRIEVARRGARMILPMDIPAADLADAVGGVLALVRASAPKVLAVDPDPFVLGTVGSLLDARGLDVTTLGDSGRFWDVFNQGAPDLVVVGAEMSPVSGLELCRGVREDPFWRLIPVVMLTKDNDPPAIERVFAAGADDFVAKPVVGPELVTRIANRLERFYWQRQQTGTDALTGVTTRTSSDQHIRRLIRLAARSELPLSLIVLDVDHLHRINQRHGVAGGDLVLRRLGQLLLKMLRAEDVVARLGGDEFVVVMHNARKQDAIMRLQLVSDSFAQETFSDTSGKVFTAQFSAAVVQYLLDGTDVQWLYDAAGHLLAQIKAEGGGQVRAADRQSDAEEDASLYDVVIVEEDEGVASVVQRSLMNQGLRPIWIRDGEQAVRKLAGAVPSLRAKVVVLEVDLPGLDGLAVLRRLADDHVLQQTRVIVLTNRSNEDEIVAAFETGAFDHVTKPFSLRVLTQRIRRAMQG